MIIITIWLGDHMVAFHECSRRKARTKNKLNPQNGTQLQSNQGHTGGT